MSINATRHSLPTRTPAAKRVPAQKGIALVDNVSVKVEEKKIVTLKAPDYSTLRCHIEARIFHPRFLWDLAEELSVLSGYRYREEQSEHSPAAKLHWNGRH
jgi:hypothetical protein